MAINSYLLNEKLQTQYLLYLMSSSFMNDSINYLTTELNKEINLFINKIAFRISKDVETIPVYSNSNIDLTNIGTFSSFLESSIEKASRIYEKLYQKNAPRLEEARDFLEKVFFLFKDTQQEIVFTEDSIRIVANFYNEKFYIDYDYEFDDSVFITRTTVDSIIAEECSISEIENTLLHSLFNNNLEISVA